MLRFERRLHLAPPQPRRVLVRLNPAKRVLHRVRLEIKLPREAVEGCRVRAVGSRSLQELVEGSRA